MEVQPPGRHPGMGETHRSVRSGAAEWWAATTPSLLQAPLRRSIRSLFSWKNGGVNPVLRRKGEIGLWQPCFWEHHIRDEADYASHVRYCWINPVKHGLVARAADWPHSSIHRDLVRGSVEPEWSGALPEGEYGEWDGVSPH